MLKLIEQEPNTKKYKSQHLQQFLRSVKVITGPDPFKKTRNNDFIPFVSERDRMNRLKRKANTRIRKSEKTSTFLTMSILASPKSGNRAFKLSRRRSLQEVSPAKEDEPVRRNIRMSLSTCETQTICLPPLNRIKRFVLLMRG